MPVLKFLFSNDKSILELKNKSFEFGEEIKAIYYKAIGWFVDLANADRFKALMYLCIALIVITVVKNCCRYLAMNFMILIRNRTMRSMRLNIFNSCIQLPVAFFNEERKGDLLSRMSNDMKEIEFALMVSLEALYFQPVNIIVFITALIVLSPTLTLYVLIFLPVTAIIIGLIGRSLRKKSARNQHLIGKVLSSFEESISGIRIIKAFNVIGYFQKKYSDEDLTYTKNNIGIQRRYDLSSPVSETIGIGISAVLLWLGGNMVFKGTLEAEFFLTYFAVFSQLIPPFKAFSNALYTAEKGIASLNRIQELVTAPKVIEDAKDAAVANFKRSIEFKNVTFAYAQNNVINSINFEIKKGEMVALVGPSGAGKTTIADLVSRFYDVTEGEIMMDGENIKSFTQESLRNLLGIVSQESILFNDTVENNIRIGNLYASEEEIIESAKMANAWEFIEKMENKMQTNIGERGSKLSGGQRQRVSIARAILKNPELLILDEATSALDSQSEKLVQQALDVLMQNRTSIVIAHRLSTVMHANKIIVLDKGNIVEQGTHQELINQHGLYAQLIQLQQLV